MLIWGTRSKSLNLGAVGEQECQICEKSQSYSLRLDYDYFHLYWLFGVVTKRRYAIVCDICSRGWEIEKSKVSELVTKDPIPFMNKYGLYSVISIIMLVTLPAFFS